MIIPIRKCYHTAKIGIIVFVLVTVFTLFEHWRGRKRGAHGFVPGSKEAEYEKQILEDEARIIPGLGEGGVAVELVGHEKEIGAISVKKNAMNVYLSERIAYNRTLKDHRHPACKRVLYDAELPSVSVILIFHNEPYSVVIRTIWSVLNNARRDREWYKLANFVDKNGKTMTLGYPGQPEWSPYVYLKEIILVDDNSTLPELKGKLDHYIRTRLPADMIKVLRLPDRKCSECRTLSLTRARLFGAQVATGAVLLFLDTHCEGNHDWLRPLLQRLKDKRSALITPMVDGGGIPRARQAGARVATGQVLVFLDSQCEGEQDWMRPLAQRLKEKPTAVLMPIIESIAMDTFHLQGPANPAACEGLMKARTLGARAARGQVILFLDAHCEAASDWLRPLLQRIKHKRDAVVTPLIDVIDQDSFQLDAAEYFQVGGFNFAGHFTWVEVPEREKKRRGSEISPTWSPTMAGGLFAVDRAYFWQLGGYDELMNGWGGENLEISFRTWMCGGTLETIPCSRVGHVFRSFHPYGLPASSDTHGINTARLADVWMDDYAELYYMHRPDLRKNPTIGDLTHRKVLREKLKCKSFQWYLDNVYPEKFVPGRNTQAWGRFMNPATNLCLDSLQRSGSEGLPLGVFTCYPQLQTTQMYALSDKQRLRDEESCAEVQHHREPVTAGQPVLMFSCSSVVHERQKWQFLPTGQIKHIQSGLCLDAGHKQDTDVSVQACNKLSLSQLWLADFRKGEPINPDLIPMEDQRENLQRIMGYHSRKTRSLLMLDNNRVEPVDSRDTVTTRPRHDYTRDRPVYPHSRGYRRAHMHKRKYKRRNKKRVKNDLRGRRIKIKNRFMLTLIRTIDNKTEQHLEAEIHCRHEQLYPNNSFVRDIVRILNDHHIKVINNGRVFERNNMIDLSHERMRRKMEDVTGRDDVTARSEPITDRPRDATDMRAQPTSPSLYLQQHVDVVTSPSLRDTTTHQRVIPDDKWHRRLKSFKFRALTDAPDGLLRHSHSLSEEDLPPRVWHGEGGGTGERGGEPVMHLADERRDDPSGVNDLLSVIAEGGETRRSKNMSSARRHLDPDPAPDEQNDVSPVKFVMRSNITLNLGNQLFGRRVIELNTSSTAPTSPPTPAPLLPTTTPAPPPSVARVFDSSSDTSSESRSSD